jgi:allophanate hydrolase subunit 2
MTGPAAPGDAPADGAPTAYAHLEVVDPGTLTLVEDLGRPGYAAMGVSPSGAADRGSFALGARLLGQDTDRAALECHLGGLALRARGSVTIAITGATARATVDGVDAPHAAPLLLRDGSVLRLGRPEVGLRTYVSVRGGVAVPTVLGSRSYDTLSDLGPPPLTPGQLVPVGWPSGSPLVDVAPVRALPHGLADLTVTPGPRLDWLEDPRALAAAPWSSPT